MSGTSINSSLDAYSDRTSFVLLVDSSFLTVPLTEYPAFRSASTVRPAMYPLAPVTRTRPFIVIMRTMVILIAIR